MVVGLVMLKEHKSPRGIRNNNPLNIRNNGIKWNGLKESQADKEFLQFIEAIFGFRAGARILKSYAGRGIITLEQIINTWSPDTENDTKSYIKHAATELKINQSEPVVFEKWPELLAVMTKHENGYNPYSLEYIRRGIELA